MSKRKKNIITLSITPETIRQLINSHVEEMSAMCNEYNSTDIAIELRNGEFDLDNGINATVSLYFPND